MDFIPEELCISKQKGWEKAICASKSNFEKVLRFLYPEGINTDGFREALDEIEGDTFYIYGYED